MISPEQITRLIAHWDAGRIDDDEFRSEVTSPVLDAIRHHDPDAHGAVLQLVDCEQLSPGLVSDLAVLARAAIHESSAGPLGGPSAAHDLRERVIDRVSSAIASGRDSSRAASMVAALPETWCTPQMLRFAATADLELGHRLSVDRNLLSAAVHLDGPRRAFAGLVRPHLTRATPESVSLLAAAYDHPGLDRRDRALLREHLLAQADAAPRRTMTPVVVRMSIESDDEPAAALAMQLSARSDLAPSEPAILALAVWLAGSREEARGVVHIEPAWRDGLGWATQASRALTAFITASGGKPEDVLKLLTARTPPESPRRSIVAVGALVGRLALMRMRADLATENWTNAALEAAAVAAYHGYRGYDLHMQFPNQEFDVALTTRLAVAPDEIDEARAIARQLGHHAHGSWLDLSEGALVVRSPVGGS